MAHNQKRVRFDTHVGHIYKTLSPDMNEAGPMGVPAGYRFQPKHFGWIRVEKAEGQLNMLGKYGIGASGASTAEELPRSSR